MLFITYITYPRVFLRRRKRAKGIPKLLWSELSGKSPLLIRGPRGSEPGQKLQARFLKLLLSVSWNIYCTIVLSVRRITREHFVGSDFNLVWIYWRTCLRLSSKIAYLGQRVGGLLGVDPQGISTQHTNNRATINQEVSYELSGAIYFDLWPLRSPKVKQL